MSDMTLESVCCHVGGDSSLAWSTVELCHYIMTHSCHVISSCHYFATFTTVTVSVYTMSHDCPVCCILSIHRDSHSCYLVSLHHDS